MLPPTCRHERPLDQAQHRQQQHPTPQHPSTVSIRLIAHFTHDLFSCSAQTADSIVHHINTSRRLKQYLCTARYVLLHLLSKYLPNFSSQYFGYLVMWRKLMTLIIATIVYILPMSLFVYDPIMWLQPAAMKHGKTTTTIDSI